MSSRHDHDGAAVSAPPPPPVLVTVSGQDGPGIAARVFGALAAHGVGVEDVEQVRVHGSWLTDAAIAGRPQSQHADLRPL